MEDEKLGATGEFPEGQISPDDEGELSYRLSAGPGIVKLEFGKPITWVAFPPEEAMALSVLLAKYAGAAQAALEEQGPGIVGPDGKTPS
jgi:hypothetical protein